VREVQSETKRNLQTVKLSPKKISVRRMQHQLPTLQTKGKGRRGKAKLNKLSSAW